MPNQASRVPNLDPQDKLDKALSSEPQLLAGLTAFACGNVNKTATFWALGFLVVLYIACLDSLCKACIPWL
jgi:hypothetical protein